MTFFLLKKKSESISIKKESNLNNKKKIIYKRNFLEESINVFLEACRRIHC